MAFIVLIAALSLVALEGTSILPMNMTVKSIQGKQNIHGIYEDGPYIEHQMERINETAGEWATGKINQEQAQEINHMLTEQLVNQKGRKV